MPKKFVTDKDEVIFDKSLLPPANIIGKNKSNIKAQVKKWQIQGKFVCVAGDEKTVKLETDYKSAIFNMKPGKLKLLQILPLIPGKHLSKKHSVSNKPKVFQEGSTQFNVIWKVDTPSQLITPQGPKDDPVPIYLGKAHFIVKTTKKESESS